MRIAYETMLAEFERVLTKYGFSPKRAHEAAEIFARTVWLACSATLNRFPRVVEYLRKGEIDPAAEAECIASFGAMERWDGKRGFGPLNAKHAMDRAVELAHQFGIGMVALGNNNHWMRGGTYGWQAADAGCIGICWSNTCPNMPAWGAKDNHIGNNPLILAVPRSNGEHIMVDCALSQFSYGKLETMRLAGKQLPVVGGYDADGSLTTDPAAIEETRRMIPIGYWKGSGLSILLDMIGTILTGANSVATIGTFGDEVGLTQIMIAIDPAKFQSADLTDAVIDAIAADVASSEPAEPGREVRCPGMGEHRSRKENMELGIPAARKSGPKCWRCDVMLKGVSLRQTERHPFLSVVFRKYPAQL